MQLPTLSALKTSSNIELTRLTSLVIPIGSIIVSVLIIVLIVWPKFTEVLRLRTANRELVTRSQKLTQKVEVLEGFERVELEQQLAAAEQLLPSDKGVFSVIKQVNDSAGASGVLINRIEVAPGSIGKNLAEKPPPTSIAPGGGADGVGELAPNIGLKVSLSGDYKSFLQFLKNIISVSRVVTIRDLSVAASSSSGGSSQIRISLTLDAYWKPLPNQLASIESEIVNLTPSELDRLKMVQSTGLVSMPTVPNVLFGRPDLFAPF